MKVTAEDIAQLLASAPPRPVPAHVAQAAAAGGPGWLLLVFGLVFGGMGLLFTGLFFPWRFPDDWRLAADRARTTPGRITAVQNTNMTLNKVKVIAYDFAYTPQDGRRREGRCFTTGRAWSANAAVTVRYLPDNPELACVQGARLSQGSGSSAFVIIFPLIGGGIATGFVMDRRRRRRLLHEGLVAEVDVVSVEETMTNVNSRKVFKITVANPAVPGGPPIMVRRANPADVSLARKHLQEKQPVFILYDPRNLAQLLLPEALIGDGAQ